MKSAHNRVTSLRSTIISLMLIIGGMCVTSAIWSLLLTEQFKEQQNNFIQFQRNLVFPDVEKSLFEKNLNSFMQNVEIQNKNKKNGVQNSLSKSEILEDELESILNIPIASSGIRKVPEKRLHFENKCGKRPTFMDIEISNTYWQTMRTTGKPNSTLIFVYGAYVDTRVEPPVVRILADSYEYLNVSGMGQPQFCQFWYSGSKKPVISEINISYIWREDWGHVGHYHPYLLTCEIPRFQTSKKRSLLDLSEIPESVSVVGSRCENATNDIKITYNVPKTKEEFGVCVKGLDVSVDDISLRFIEWIEMIGILGASKIHFHVFDIHPNILKVLEHYKEREFVTMKPFTLPGFQPNLPAMRNSYIYNAAKLPMKRRQEVIAYNDCFFTHLYSYKYIVIIDYDEIIISHNWETRTWNDLLKELKVKNSASQCFDMMLFVDKVVKRGTNITLAVAPNIEDQIDGYPYMMNKLNYEEKLVCTGGKIRGVKCFHNTDNVLMVHNHQPRACLKVPCAHLVNNTLAYTHHHKQSCGKSTNGTLPDQLFGYDSTILKYKDELEQRRDSILDQIHF